TASTTSLLHPWELTVQQMLRLGGPGPQSALKPTADQVRSNADRRRNDRKAEPDLAAGSCFPIRSMFNPTVNAWRHYSRVACRQRRGHIAPSRHLISHAVLCGISFAV